uniref:Aminomethyltransferase, mitochondrial n=1 Tax=Oncorhynchus mykiss TaxID=8022 RepID=A0A8C7VBC8_ONCMY
MFFPSLICDTLGHASQIHICPSRMPPHLHRCPHLTEQSPWGRDRGNFMESMIVGDVAELTDNQGTLTLFTNYKGGMNDDLIVTKTDQGYLYVVSNAGCADKDTANMKVSTGHGCALMNTTLYMSSSGASMAQVLQSGLTDDLSKLTFMTSTLATVFGIQGCRLTCCGYTGEDGVEISVPKSGVVAVTEHLLANSEVKLAGLGARDSLRLEAGLCLYGNDIDESTTPVEATLLWTIGKRRRQANDFPSAEIILPQIKARKRVGLVSSGPPVRQHTPIPRVSYRISTRSGCHIRFNFHFMCFAMGYVDAPYAKNGTPIQVEVRKKPVVTKMPFMPTNYYSGQ